jgi:hypothetical protein
MCVPCCSTGTRIRSVTYGAAFAIATRVSCIECASPVSLCSPLLLSSLLLPLLVLLSLLFVFVEGLGAEIHSFEHLQPMIFCSASRFRRQT